MAKSAVRDRHIATVDQLVRELAWYATKQSTQMLMRPDINLTLPQMITLFAIHGCGTCRMSTLAEITQQSAGTLTGIVDRLINDGLVERARNIGDRRVVEVALTDEGQARLERVIAARSEGMRRILAQFAEEDLEQFEVLLGRFLEGLRQQANDAPEGLARAAEV